MEGMRFDWQMVATIVVAMVVALLVSYALTAYTVRFDNWRRRCMEAGYSEVEVVRDGWRSVYYCVGLRDGNTVSVRVEDLD